MIDFESYKLSQNNYYKEVYDKTQIVIGNTNHVGMQHYPTWIYRINGKNKKTSHFTITKEGKIYQHFDPIYYSDFLNNQQDKASISIVLENIGWYRKDAINGKYVDWLGKEYIKTEEEVLMKRWRNHTYWDIYSEEQMLSLKKLVSELCSKYGIEKRSVGTNVHNEDIDLFNGITFRSNYYQELTDVNPSFKFEVLQEI